MHNPNIKTVFLFQNSNDKLQIVPNSLEHAYIAILNDNLNASKMIFSKLDSPRSKWGVSLSQILEGNLIIFPTFFQIRNFLEIDLDFLIKNEKVNYVEYLLGSLEILSSINPETYKYVARTMFSNNYTKLALEYTEKAKIALYNDAELHFMLAKYYLEINDKNNSNHYINECLKYAPNYHPALKLLSSMI